MVRDAILVVRRPSKVPMFKKIIYKSCLSQLSELKVKLFLACRSNLPPYIPHFSTAITPQSWPNSFPLSLLFLAAKRPRMPRRGVSLKQRESGVLYAPSWEGSGTKLQPLCPVPLCLALKAIEIYRKLMNRWCTNVFTISVKVLTTLMAKFSFAIEKIICNNCKQLSTPSVHYLSVDFGSFRYLPQPLQLSNYSHG